MMDAVGFVARRTGTARGKWVFSLVFLFPILGYLVSRIARNRWWFCDFDALMCGAAKVAQGVSPYGVVAHCDGMDPAPFVYAPQIAQVFVPVVNLFGAGGSRILCLMLIIPTLLTLIWWTVLRPFPNAPWQLRLMTLAAMTGSVLACGNIGLMLHALVIAAATQIRQRRWLFIAIVVLGALVKPFFLTYLVVLAYEEKPVWSRLGMGLGAALVGVGAVLGLFLTAGPLSDEWHAALDAVVMARQPGIGYFAFIKTVGVDPSSWLALAGLGLFMAVIGLSGLVLVELGELTQGERVMMGLGVAQLLNPRPMDYDMWLLAPMIAAVVMLSTRLGPRVFMRVGWTFAGTLIGCVVINVLEVEHIHRAPVTVFVYCGIVVAVAGTMAWQRRADVVDRLNRIGLIGITARWRSAGPPGAGRP